MKKIKNIFEFENITLVLTEFWRLEEVILGMVLMGGR